MLSAMINEPIIFIIMNWSLDCIQACFHLASSFCPRIHAVFRWGASRGSLWLSLILKTLTALRIPQVFCRVFPSWFCLMCFSWLDWGYGLLWGRPQKWSAILITGYQGNILSLLLSTVDVNLDHFAEGLSGFSTIKVTLFCHFHTKVFGREVTMCAHMSEMGSYALILGWWKICINYSFTFISLFKNLLEWTWIPILYFEL